MVAVNFKTAAAVFALGAISMSAVDVGGDSKGTIEVDDFARAFLSIWLGGTCG